MGCHGMNIGSEVARSIALGYVPCLDWPVPVNAKQASHPGLAGAPRGLGYDLKARKFRTRMLQKGYGFAPMCALVEV